MAVCLYLSLEYSDAVFLSDTIAAVKLTGPQKVRNQKIQKKGFKCPDVLILEPRGNYAGLFIELKVETPFKKNGEIKASSEDHLKGQYETIKHLNRIGYKACFSWNFEMTKQTIDEYFKLPKIVVPNSGITHNQFAN